MTEEEVLVQHKKGRTIEVSITTENFSIVINCIDTNFSDKVIGESIRKIDIFVLGEGTLSLSQYQANKLSQLLSKVLPIFDNELEKDVKKKLTKKGLIN